MNQKKIIYECFECGTQYQKWEGKCNQCGEWDTIKSIEKFVANTEHQYEISEIKTIDEIDLQQEYHRWKTNVEEFDRVLGGGIVLNSVGLLGGEPGVGKSTLILQLLARMITNNKKVLYVSGEESELQIKDRANRLAISQKGIYLVVETILERIIQITREQKFDFIVIDSIQTLYSENISSHAGGPVQIKECAMRLLHEAKKNGITLIIIGHVTKEGIIAGPKLLEHIVDYVFYLEGEKSETIRILRAVKNRFGPVTEIGLFKMTSKGLAEVKNPNALFQENIGKNYPGKVTFIATEGTRQIFVDTQALVGRNTQNSFQRTANGIEKNKLLMLIAIIEKHLKVNLYGSDIYLNLADGFKANDATIDLPAITAILTSHFNLLISNEVVFFGEISLTGEFKPPTKWQERLTEASRCSYKQAITPKIKNMQEVFTFQNLSVRTISNISELLPILKQIQT